MASPDKCYCIVTAHRESDSYRESFSDYRWNIIITTDDLKQQLFSLDGSWYETAQRIDKEGIKEVQWKKENPCTLDVTAFRQWKSYTLDMKKVVDSLKTVGRAIAEVEDEESELWKKELDLKTKVYKSEDLTEQEKQELHELGIAKMEKRALLADLKKVREDVITRNLVYKEIEIPYSVRHVRT